MACVAGESGHGKGNFVVLTLRAETPLKWKCHPFSWQHCVDEDFVDISESNCNHVGISQRWRILPDASTTEGQGGNVFKRQQRVTCFCHSKATHFLSSTEVSFVASCSQRIHRLGRSHVTLACLLTYQLVTKSRACSNSILGELFLWVACKITAFISWHFSFFHAMRNNWISSAAV